MGEASRRELMTRAATVGLLMRHTVNSIAAIAQLNSALRNVVYVLDDCDAGDLTERTRLVLDARNDALQRIKLMRELAVVESGSTEPTTPASTSETEPPPASVVTARVARSILRRRWLYVSATSAYAARTGSIAIPAGKKNAASRPTPFLLPQHSELAGHELLPSPARPCAQLRAERAKDGAVPERRHRLRADVISLGNGDDSASLAPPPLEFFLATPLLSLFCPSAGACTSIISLLGPKTAANARISIRV